jgi:hypothetical protein
MIEVHEGRPGTHVVARRGIPAGTLILKGWGEPVERRTPRSFQVDHDLHIEIRGPIARIRHSCEPNCGVLVRREARLVEIHSLRGLEAGEELVIDYATFEYVVEHFRGDCQCGAPSCRRRITGFRGLPTDRRAAYGRFLAPYLREIEAGVRPIAVDLAPAELEIGFARVGDVAVAV